MERTLKALGLIVAIGWSSSASAQICQLRADFSASSSYCEPTEPQPPPPAPAPSPLVAPDIFNWRFYLNNYADLLNAGIVTPQAAETHWKNQGIKECRRAHPLFHTEQYLKRYSDLKAAFGSDCTAALNHYINFGRAEKREGLYGTTYLGRVTVKNAIIAVGASTRTAGAIDSLYWNGREFINSWDHGRQLQVAWSMNGKGECYNPTEAGSESDGIRSTSSSSWLTSSASGNSFATSSRPAFWLLPHQRADCVDVQQNPEFRAHKTVAVGMSGISPHLIEFLTQADLPESVSHMAIEAPTGYLGGEFTAFHTWDPATCQLAALSTTPGEQRLPIVLSTPDGTAAMGAWSPDLPSPGFANVGYGRFAFPNAGNPAGATNKWNVVFRLSNLQPGSFYFRSYIAVGTRENVRVALCQANAAI